MNTNPTAPQAAATAKDDHMSSIDKTPVTEFGWGRAGLYTMFTLAIFIACWVVTLLVSKTMAPWIEPGFPSMTMAIACGVAWEYMRRNKERKARR